ncbi:WSSV084 [White spot syndrome virus]|uniref:WSSV084 n=1 Tax=White spot syndrome virus TaxID=342409 RepID=A0A2I6SBM9_9VIRU|nr:WSSV084 [White spot syndrome virus]
MSGESSSQLNTTCDQNLVNIDQTTGFPVLQEKAGRKKDCAH